MKKGLFEYDQTEDDQMTLERNPFFMVPSDVLFGFREAASQQDVAMARIIEQFIESYIHCLDPSFVDDAGIGKKGTKLTGIRTMISYTLFNAFLRKVRKQGGNPNELVVQFMSRYTAFVKDLSTCSDATKP